MEYNPILMVLLIVAVGVLPTVIAVQYIIEADARGCDLGGHAFNAAKGRCFHP